MLRRHVREGLDQDAALGRLEDDEVGRIDRAPVGLVGGLGPGAQRPGGLGRSIPACGQGQPEKAGGNSKRDTFHFLYFSNSAVFTSGVTNGVMLPPRLAISFTSREATA